ncbi:MAG: DEAD/DEAH box helicase [Dokdonella sp.]
MDKSAFHQLLASRIATFLDQRTLEKGADYLRRGRVDDVIFLSNDTHSGIVIGQVQGSAHDPYVTSIRASGVVGQVQFTTDCSCPMVSRCKHVAALALHLLGTRNVAPESDSITQSQRLGMWPAWFDALEASTTPPARGASSTASQATTERVFGLLLKLGTGTLPGLLIQPVWLTPNKRGGLGAPQPVGYASYGADPWERLTPEQFDHVAQLRMRSQGFSGVGVWHRLTSPRDEEFLGDLLKSHSCFFDKPANGPIALAGSRALTFAWQTRNDGSQQLIAQLADGSPKAKLFRIGGLWYVDPVVRAIGRVDAHADIVEAALSAPSLLPEQAKPVIERWQKAVALKSLPEPAKPRAIETHRVTPTPVLTLRAFPVASYLAGDVVRNQASCVRLSFDYAGPRLPFAPAEPRERRMHEGRLLDIVRDRAAEIAAYERLEELGFIDAEQLPPMRGLPRGVLAEGDFVLEPSRGQLAPAEQIFALATRLRDDGFVLETDSEFPFELLDEPDDWYAEVNESGNAWFDLSLGIDIAGERVDLLPILRRVFEDPTFPLEPRRGEADDAMWLVAVDDRRRVALPLARLRSLLAPLLEWLQGSARDAESGVLRLRRAQAGVVEELALPWHGGERLREMAEALHAPRETAIEPSGFTAMLRPYQRDGLAWLDFLAEVGLGGILADDMGLGKTVQVLAHLLAEKKRGRLAQPALIIVPTSLVANWRDEAQRFTPDLSVLVVHGPARAGLHDAIPQHDLVITTYPLLLRDRDELIAHEYALLVFDEAQAIKNAKSQAAKIVREIPARRRLAMTGTPLENHLGELWAQFDAVEPGLLGSEKQFTKFYRTPIEKHGDSERRERLGRRIAPFLLRRRKQDVLADLPPKTFIERGIELEGDQRELYETLRLAQHERIMGEVKKRGLAQSGIIVLDALLKLRQVCCDPRLVKLDSAREVQQSAKLDLLLELTDSLVDEGRNVLIFSQFAEMLALIGKALDARKQIYQTLTGQTPGVQRAALVRKFQAGKMPLFLISLKAGGVGLNLTAADTVIHYDPWWNPAVEAQATDRAHRIGQDKPVFVYKLICTGTVEEKILALQQRKADLAAAVLDGGSSQSLSFDQTDLDELFAPL